MRPELAQPCAKRLGMPAAHCNRVLAEALEAASGIDGPAS
jgi:hypothetical protein